MVKTRVHDLAAEFGVAPEQLLSMLKDMNIFVRSHLSALETDQVSAVRVRWEREKRKQRRGAGRQEGPPQGGQGGACPGAGRGASRPSAAAPPPRCAAGRGAGRRPRRRPSWRRSSWSAPSCRSSKRAAPTQTLEERARALFKDLPPAPAGGRRSRDRCRGRAGSPRAVTPRSRPAARAGSDARAPRSSRRGSSVRAAAPTRRPQAGLQQQRRRVAPSRRPPRRSAPAAPRRVRARRAPPVRTFGPDAEKGGGRKKGQEGQALVGGPGRGAGQHPADAPGHEGSRRAARAAAPTSRRSARCRPAGWPRRRSGRRPGFGSTSSSRSPSSPAAMKVPRHPDRPVRLQGAGPDGDGEPAARLRPDRADRVRLRFRGGAGGRVRRRGRERRGRGRRRSSWSRGRRSSPSWVTSTTARRRCSTTSARPTSSPARRAASRSTSARTTSTLPGDRTITFLDTPGHQAFTAMRARGAQVTDIVVLVVAADDQVMPQTIEAISHARNAGVPMIVAINKIDLPSANVQKVKQDLLQHNVVLEEFGGTRRSRPRSPPRRAPASTTLLEQILLQSEILDLKANPDGKAPRHRARGDARSGQGPAGHDPGPEGHAARAATTSSAASSPAACARCTTSAARR